MHRTEHGHAPDRDAALRYCAATKAGTGGAVGGSLAGMAKVRVYELGKELGMESKKLLQILRAEGEFNRSATSTVEARWCAGCGR